MTPFDPSFKVKLTPNQGGKRTATRLIVLHYTASSSLDSTVDWLCNKLAKASAHFVVGRDGAVVQLADTNAVTWHAGASSWKGAPSVNSYSIGIEMLNLGPLKRVPAAAGKPVSYRANGSTLDIPESDVFHGRHQTDRACPYEHWQRYPDAQVAAVDRLLSKLLDAYPHVEDVVGHSDIAPGRKIDPGPAARTSVAVPKRVV